jgi:hypothetical protein
MKSLRHQPCLPSLGPSIPEASQESISEVQNLEAQQVRGILNVYDTLIVYIMRKFGLCLGALPRAAGMDIKLWSLRPQGRHLTILPLGIRPLHPARTKRSSANIAHDTWEKPWVCWTDTYSVTSVYK